MTGFYNRKDLICGILVVLFLLSVCMTIDYADDTIINDNGTSLNKTLTKEAIPVNGTAVVALNNTARVIVVKSNDKIHYEHPIITITARPSCGCRYGYYWHKRTFISYCPHCHRYGTLYNAHKYPARHEQELTCRHCGADYCGVCGKEKYSWSHYYLRKA